MSNSIERRSCLLIIMGAAILFSRHVTGKPVVAIDEVGNNSDLLELFLNTVQLLVDHAIKSRDLNNHLELYAETGRQNSKFARFKRQLNLASIQQLLGGALAQGIQGTQGSQGTGSSGGLGFVENIAQSVSDFDRLRCINRMLCESMATRGSEFRNRTSSSSKDSKDKNKNKQDSSSPLNSLLTFTDPSTFRSLLGILQLFRMNQLSSYPYLEAALWGTHHGSTDRCKSLFSSCPSTSEAFIDQLNNTPGGLQGVITRIANRLRPQGAGGTEQAIESGVSNAAAAATDQLGNPLPDDLDTSGFFDAFGNFIPFDTDTDSSSSVGSATFDSSLQNQQNFQFVQNQQFIPQVQQVGQQFQQINQQFQQSPVQQQVPAFNQFQFQQAAASPQFGFDSGFGNTAQATFSSGNFVSKREFGHRPNTAWRWN